MIVTDHLIFLQLQKTGCTHVSRLLQEEFSGREVDGKHRALPRRLMNDGRLIVGSVRNPWDWYVSLWTFSCTGTGGPYHRTTAARSVIRALRDARVRRFVGWRSGVTGWIGASRSELDRPVERWRELQSDLDDAQSFRAWLKLVLDSRRRYDLFRDYGHSNVWTFAGLLTYLYELLYLRDNSVLYGTSGVHDLDALARIDEKGNILGKAIRTESLEKDLLEALTLSGTRLTAQQVQRIEGAERTNVSGRKVHVASLYDPETRDLVAERERLIILKYGYHPPELAQARAT